MTPSRDRLTLWIAILALAWYPVRLFWAGGVCPREALERSLQGQVFLVTGANTGIGFETAKQLAKQNATVVMACRSAARAQAAVDFIRADVPHASVTAMDLDLSDLASVRSFATSFLAAYPRLDGLINNAGVMMNPTLRTAQGFELQMGVNHLGHFLLTELLKERLIVSAPSRVVLVSSRASEQGDIDLADLNWEARRYNAYKAYADSKLANLLHARGLAKRLNGTGVTAYAVHPGVVRTELFKHIPLIGAYSDTLLSPITYTFFKSPWEGAQTTLYTALDEALPSQPGANGGYFADAALKRNIAPQAYDESVADALWELSEKLVGPA